MSNLSELIPLSSVLPINVGLKAAREETMISCLGRPHEPLSTNDQPERASDLVKALRINREIGNVKAYGIRPAVDSLEAVLTAAFATNAQLEDELQGNGMLVVRYRHPTSGAPSTMISNHSWGTAIDFKLKGQPSVGATGDRIPRYIAMLIPHFNKAGWYSGVGFKDDMHFEVADQTIRAWAAEGRFKAPAARGADVAARAREAAPA